MIRRISPEEAQTADYIVVDVREFPEHAAGAIRSASLVPLSTVERESVRWDKESPLLLVCRSGKRATKAAETLEQLGFRNTAVLDGGMEAWQKAGLPVEVAENKPWSLERQVRAIAGGMVLVSMLLGLGISPWFYGLTLFVGAGLLFAGITDFCLMATVLGKLPWNRVQGSACEARAQ